MSLVNETKFLYQHESRQHKYRLNKSVCNSKQKWNHNEFRCKNVKKLMIGLHVKKITYGILASVVVDIKHVKMMNIQILKVALVKNDYLVNWQQNVKMKH